jgi:hypothetical protein
MLGWRPLASLPVQGIVRTPYESQRHPCDAYQDHDNDQQLGEMAANETH